MRQDTSKQSIPGVNMERKHAYATKADLEKLARRMQKTGIFYSEATREFKKQFILVALRSAQWNQCRAAQALGMHRNTLGRIMQSVGIDVPALRGADRLPPQEAAAPAQTEIAS